MNRDRQLAEASRLALSAARCIKRGELEQATEALNACREALAVLESATIAGHGPLVPPTACSPLSVVEVHPGRSAA